MSSAAFLFGVIPVEELPVELMPLLDRAAEAKEFIDKTAVFFLALGGDRKAEAKIVAEIMGHEAVWKKFKAKALRAMKEKNQPRSLARKVGGWLAKHPEEAAIMLVVHELSTQLKKELEKVADESVRFNFNTVGLPDDIREVTSTAYGVITFVNVLAQMAEVIERIDETAEKWLKAFEINFLTVTRNAVARLKSEVARLRKSLESVNAAFSAVARDLPAIGTIRANNVHELAFKVGRYALDRIALGQSSGVRAFASEESIDGGRLQAGKRRLHDDRLLLAALKRFPKFSTEEIENLLAGEALRLSHERESRMAISSASQAKGPWSTPDSPSRWAKRFKCSVDTFQRWVDDGSIRVRKLSDRSYQLHVDDVPVHVDGSVQSNKGGQKSA